MKKFWLLPLLMCWTFTLYSEQYSHPCHFSPKEYNIEAVDSIISELYTDYLLKFIEAYPEKSIENLSQIIQLVEAQEKIKSDYNYYIYYLRGKEYECIDKYDLAIQDYTRYLNNGCYEFEDLKLQALRDRAYAYLRLGKKNEFFKDFQSVVAAEPNYAKITYEGTKKIFAGLDFRQFACCQKKLLLDVLKIAGLIEKNSDLALDSQGHLTIPEGVSGTLLKGIFGCDEEDITEVIDPYKVEAEFKAEAIDIDLASTWRNDAMPQACINNCSRVGVAAGVIASRVNNLGIQLLAALGIGEFVIQCQNCCRQKTLIDCFIGLKDYIREHLALMFQESPDWLLDP